MISTFRSFSRHHGFRNYDSEESPVPPQCVGKRIFLLAHLDDPTGVNQNPAFLILMRPSITPSSSCRNLDLLSIDYAFRPRLRSRLSLGGRPFPRNPCPYGDRDSHPVYRYSYRHPHFPYLQQPFRSAFAGLGNAPLPEILSDQSAASVHRLSPDHFRRTVTRPVSYYALFKGWLLLSQPPGCLCNGTSLSTER